MKINRKKLVLSALSILIAMTQSLMIAPARAADDNWPLPPEPSWWKQSGLEGIRAGQWLPCKTEWKSTNDCIKSVTWTKIDGSKSAAAIFTPNPNFDPMTAKQVWLNVKGPDGNYYDNSANFKDIYPGDWRLPEGFSNSDGSTDFMAHVHLMGNNLQANIVTSTQASLPTDSYVEVVVVSKNASKYFSWIMSSIKDPSVTLDGDVITMRGMPAPSPLMSGVNNNVCDSGNQEKASSSRASVAINLTFKNVGNRVSDSELGDLVLATNGWWCFNGVYFDQQSQSLVVKTGTAHYDENGKVVEGWFELKVKGNRARQWWGMNPNVAAANAKVEIIYENGERSVATVVSRYDAKNDWIALIAGGYHFSSPAVAVSFKKADEPTPTPTASASAAPLTVAKAPKRTTITCVKGKSTKKITDVNPKCPTGYKKK